MDVTAVTVDGCRVSAVADATPALLKCLSLFVAITVGLACHSGGGGGGGGGVSLLCQHI